MLSSQNLKQTFGGMKSTQKEVQSNYDPYSIEDYKKIKAPVKEMPKGLGSNMGDEKWQNAQQ